MTTSEPSLAPREVDVASIERELAALWQPTAEDEASTGPATRACMSNLLIYCETAREAEKIVAEIEPIVQQHPSRVLTLVSEGSAPGRDVDAYVSATCYAGEGGRRICSEVVALHAGVAPERRLPAIARPLVIGDLPTALWWTSATPAPLGGDFFREMVPMCQQLIVDSADWRDPAAGLAATARWASTAPGAPGVCDLAWTRTHPWRSALGQALDPQSVPAALATLRRVRIEYGPAGTTQALLVAAWLASRLGWEPVVVRPSADRLEARYRGRAGEEVHVEAARTDAATGLQTLTVGWAEGDGPREMSLRRIGQDRLGVIRGEGDPHHVRPLLERSRAWLVARELPDLGRDRSFREALYASRRLVQAS